MPQVDVERIARTALKELGVEVSSVVVARVTDQPGVWQVEFPGSRGPARLRIKCGPGTTAQWVREQIFQQYLAQS